ncbi:MAG: hypothetical protein VCA17_16400 [Dehalococcoidia bacterium]
MHLEEKCRQSGGSTYCTRAIAQIEIVENPNNGDDVAYDHFVLSN